MDKHGAECQYWADGRSGEKWHMGWNGQRVVAVEKLSGPAYLDAVFAAWANGDVTIQVDRDCDTSALGVAIDERAAIAAGGGWWRGGFIPDHDPRPAQISFTSGTTGTPKALVIARRAVSDVTRRLIDIMALDASIREYVAVPVTFSFGLGRARAVAAVGGQAYLPPHGFRPDELAAMLESEEVNALAAVPTMLRAILARPAPFERCGDRLRWLEIGSQYMSGDEKARIRALFPNARIVQHYGLTEASRTSFLRIDSAPPAALESVGVPTGEAQVEIDADGRIRIRGPHVAGGVLADGTIRPITDADGWLTTSDLGRLDGELLFFEGRADDVANISGIKVSADHFEQRLLDRIRLAADSVAVTAREDALRGQSLVVARTATVEAAPLRAAALALAAEHMLGAADISFVTVDFIPRTATGKVQRARLAEICAAAAPAAADAENPDVGGAGADLSANEAAIARMWQQALGVDHVARDDSFFDIGGDSLSAITLMLRAEQAGMPQPVIQQMLDGRTVAEIAASIGGADDSPGARSGMALINDATNAARGILVLIVIGAHWGPFLFDRLGAYRTAAYDLVHPFFRIGTPGFAMVFGLGLSFYYMGMLERSPARLRAKLRANAVLLGAGILLLAAVKALQIRLTGDDFDALWPERLFYDVLLFYFLMMLGGGLLLRTVTATRHHLFNALAVGLAGLLALLGIRATWPEAAADGFVSLAWHMLAAPYSVPQMLIAVSLGLALGTFVRGRKNDPALTGTLARMGIILFVSGTILVAGHSGGWRQNAGTPLSFVAYIGAIALLLAGLLAIARRAWIRGAMRMLILVGLLAFPAFVAHGLVIPVKDIVMALGLAYFAAMAVSLGLFVAAAGMALRRMHRIYYGGETGTATELALAER